VNAWRRNRAAIVRVPLDGTGVKELAVHDRVYNCYAENYREQVKRHEEEFAEA